MPYMAVIILIARSEIGALLDEGHFTNFATSFHLLYASVNYVNYTI